MYLHRVADSIVDLNRRDRCEVRPPGFDVSKLHTGQATVIKSICSRASSKFLKKRCVAKSQRTLFEAVRKRILWHGTGSARFDHTALSRPCRLNTSSTASR